MSIALGNYTTSPQMANYQGHVFWSFVGFGLICYIITTYNLVQLDYIQWLSALLIFLFASLAPDVDNGESYIGKFVGVEIALTGLACLLEYIWLDDWRGLAICVCCLVLLIPLYLSTHRGFFHSISAGLFLSIPFFYFFGTVWGVMFFLGYSTHLLVDRCIKLW